MALVPAPVSDHSGLRMKHAHLPPPSAFGRDIVIHVKCPPRSDRPDNLTCSAPADTEPNIVTTRNLTCLGRRRKQLHFQVQTLVKCGSAGFITDFFQACQLRCTDVVVCGTAAKPHVQYSVTRRRQQCQRACGSTPSSIVSHLYSFMFRLR